MSSKKKNAKKPSKLTGVYLKRWLADYAFPPTTPGLNRFDLIITGSPMVPPPEAKPNTLKIAYLSWSEVAPDAWYKKDAKETGVKILGSNERWHSDFYDLADSRWSDFICELAIFAKESGYDGVYLDTFDGAWDLADLLDVSESSEKFQSWLNGGRDVCAKIRDAWINCFLIVNRGFEMFKDAPGHPGVLRNAKAVMVEGLTRNRDGAEPGKGERQWMIQNLIKVRDLGKPVLTLDYANKKDAPKAMERARKNGFIPLVVKDTLVSPRITGLP